MHNQTLPLAITPKYVEHLPDEVLIFDGQRLLAHCMDSKTWCVFQACDGKTTIDELEQRLRQQFPDLQDPSGLIESAVAEFDSNKLLKSPLPTRRQALAGLAAAAAVPLLVSCLAPLPAMAGTGIDALACNTIGSACTGAQCGRPILVNANNPTAGLFCLTAFGPCVNPVGFPAGSAALACQITSGPLPQCGVSLVNCATANADCFANGSCGGLDCYMCC
jgi:hypothetical protein